MSVIELKAAIVQHQLESLISSPTVLEKCKFVFPWTGCAVLERIFCFTLVV